MYWQNQGIFFEIFCVKCAENILTVRYEISLCSISEMIMSNWSITLECAVVIIGIIKINQ